MKSSAGILLYRLKEKHVEVFLVHPGGPLWKNKDTGAWSIPKGELDGQDAFETAKREFQEETGSTIQGMLLPLSPVQQKSGKRVFAWAVAGDIDPGTITSNTFQTEWPPKSGKQIEVPEIDKGDWFILEVARKKINTGQVPLLDELEKRLSVNTL